MAGKNTKSTKKKAPKEPKADVAVNEIKTENATGKLGIKLTKKNLKIIAGLVIILVFGLLVWQYTKAKSELKKYNDPSKAIQEQSEGLVKQIEKETPLPSSETPVPFEVKDINKFKDNPVFARAKNGDKGLIYQESGWIVIYRPSTKQVIAASPVSLNENDKPQ